LDYKLNYANAGFASQFEFYFMLENGLGANDYLKLVFPFAMHTTITSNVPTNLKATLTY
jgi:hypothetical protein